MTLTIDIEPELEAELRQEAARTGQDARHFIVNTLKERLRGNRQRVSAAPPHLSPGEADLLQRINEGPPPETWQQYNALVAKRRSGTLTPDEHATLIALSNQVEEANARRIGYLVELARLRGTSLPALMDDLGIPTPSYV
jgi:hypothetical protein